MEFISPGTENDKILIILSIVILIIGSGLVFGILSRFIINDNKKARNFLLIWIALGMIFSLIAFFKNYTMLGLIALFIYIVFIITVYLYVEKKRN